MLKRQTKPYSALAGAGLECSRLPDIDLLERIAAIGSSENDAWGGARSANGGRRSAGCTRIFRECRHLAIVLGISYKGQLRILEEYNKDLVSSLVSFCEEQEPELRAAVPLLFGSAFTRQTTEHLHGAGAWRP